MNTHVAPPVPSAPEMLPEQIGLAATIDAISAQRNDALNALANAHGQLTVLRHQMANDAKSRDEARQLARDALALFKRAMALVEWYGERSNVVADLAEVSALRAALPKSEN